MESLSEKVETVEEAFGAMISPEMSMPKMPEIEEKRPALAALDELHGLRRLPIDDVFALRSIRDRAHLVLRIRHTLRPNSIW